jgi:hypothetical protein
MKPRDRFAAKARAEGYCRSVCDVYAAGVIDDEQMELLIDEVLGLRASVDQTLWARLGRLTPANGQRVLASSGRASGLSGFTLAWLTAFVERGEAALIGRALETMETYIIHLRVSIPNSIPLDDERKRRTRRSFQRYYHNCGTAKFVWTSFNETDSPGSTRGEATVLAGSYDAIVTSLQQIS